MSQKMKASKPIPISAGALIAKKYGYEQVVILARKTGQGGMEHLTTYGINKLHCDIAASVGSFLKRKVLKWEEELK